MASDTTQPVSGATHAEAGTLDPAAIFTLEEAAGRVRVPVEDLEARCDRGELLFETRRRGRRLVRYVRGMDLAEAFPGAPGPTPSGPIPSGRSPEGVAGRGPDATDVASPSREVAGPPTPGHGTMDRSPAPRPALAVGTEEMADAVRSSGASRDALIGLCQDLETRLDLADRERQASTASLLMAQRRVLDLELQQRSRPWARLGGAALGLMSVSALAVMAALPGWLDERALGRASSLRAQLASDLGALEASLGALVAASGAERVELESRLESSAAALDEERRRVEQLVADAGTERTSAERARLAGLARIGELTTLLEASDRQAAQRSAELVVVVEAGARDRARFSERLAAAERQAAAARSALSEAEATANEERRVFLGRLGAADEVRAAEDAAREAEAGALRAEIKALMAEIAAGQVASLAALEAARVELEAQLEAQLEERTPVEVWALKSERREPWWARAFRLMSASAD